MDIPNQKYLQEALKHSQDTRPIMLTVSDVALLQRRSIFVSNERNDQLLAERSVTWHPPGRNAFHPS